jgi:hypothetical protein
MAETITINLDTAARGPAGADGAATFTALTDTPSSYTGQGLKFVRVNSGGTALEFVTASGTGDALVSGTLDQFADVTQTSGATLAISASTTLNGGTHSGTNTGDQDLSSYVTLTGTQTLSNKTLTTPALGTPLSGNFSSGTFTWPTFNQSTTGNAATVTTINGRIAEGTNVTLTGTGTAADPYVISAAGGGGGGGTWGSITGTLGDQTDLQSALDAKISSDITGLTGGTEIYNIVGITKAGYAAVGTPDANTYYIITDASMGDYGFPVIGEWTADTGAITATPAAGELRWDNATQTSATNLYLDGVTAGGIDMASQLLLVSKSDKILVQSTAGNYQIWQLSATPSVSSGNWTFPATLLSSAGDGTTNFADGSALIVSVRPAGEKKLVTDYLIPVALTSSTGIAWDISTTTQPTLTLAHNTTITLSNLGDGQSASLSGIMGGSGTYTVALAHSGLTVRVMGGALADIAGLAANDLFEISVKRSGTDLRVWVNTLEI